jgi:hypothetical protein
MEAVQHMLESVLVFTFAIKCPLYILSMLFSLYINTGAFPELFQLMRLQNF